MAHATLRAAHENRPYYVTWWPAHRVYQIFPAWYNDGQYVWITTPLEEIIWLEIPDEQ
jgi:hypothetical protein